MRRRRVGRTIGGLALALIAACSNPLGRQYEYEEQLYLRVDGSATVVIDVQEPQREPVTIELRAGDRLVAREERTVEGRGSAQVTMRSRARVRWLSGGGNPPDRDRRWSSALQPYGCHI